MNENNFDPMTGQSLNNSNIQVDGYNRFDPVTGQPLNNNVQNNQNNSFDPVTGQPLNNNVQGNQNNNFDPNTGQPLNNQVQMNNNINQQNNNNNISLYSNEELDKAFKSLKNDFLLIAIIHFLSTVLGVLSLNYGIIVILFRMVILGFFIYGFVSAKNKQQSAITVATITAILLFITFGYIEIGLGIFLLLHSSKCSKVIKGN